VWDVGDVEVLGLQLVFFSCWLAGDGAQKRREREEPMQGLLADVRASDAAGVGVVSGRGRE